MRNAKTVSMATNTAMSTSYGDAIEQPASLGALFAHGGQVILNFQRSGGTHVTFYIEEYFNSITGWVPRVEDDGTNLTTIERVSTLASFSYAFTTLAEKIKVYVKDSGSGTLSELNLTVGEIL